MVKVIPIDADVSAIPRRLGFLASDIAVPDDFDSLARNDFRVEPRRLRRGLIDNGWHELAVTSEHAVATLDLPAIHKDPFDRVLLGQAQVESLTLVTSDATMARYPGQIREV